MVCCKVLPLEEHVCNMYLDRPAVLELGYFFRHQAMDLGGKSASAYGQTMH